MDAEMPEPDPFGRGRPEHVREWSVGYLNELRSRATPEEAAQFEASFAVDSTAIIAHFRENGWTDLQIGVMIGLNEARGHFVRAGATGELLTAAARQGFLTLGLFLQDGAPE